METTNKEKFYLIGFILCLALSAFATGYDQGKNSPRRISDTSLEVTVNRTEFIQRPDGRMSVSFSNHASNDIFAFGSVSSEDQETIFSLMESAQYQVTITPILE